ncbi:MAG: class I SAM-dependent methyltransferase [Actinomycetota bacterium]|nr:class I SAM-dependent methyltransferase [Actinomycetota bacterium]MEE2958153.1 class I SAM-dependent methyltransferase [Actinomycetota bacterium]
MICRSCGSALELTFLDLGNSPPSNAYLSAGDLDAPETWYPLRVMACGDCRLVQTRDFARAEDLFTEDYAYFSGFSSSWRDHCRRYADQMVDRLGLGSESLVVEVACNDGTLLAEFLDRGTRCLGVEPTASTAAAARDLGLEVVEEFVGVATAERLAADGVSADLLAANNVVAHVPDIVDFVRGCGILLAPDGVATFEFPHLLRLVEGVQFDTVYHEHFSYLSLTSLSRVVEAVGLVVHDVEEVPTHGGSLRVHLGRLDGGHPVSPSVGRLLDLEEDRGLCSDAYYRGFQAEADRVKDDLLRFLLEARAEGRSVAAYGAAAKGNTLLNYAGVRPDLVPFVVDRNPAKQGRFLPGSRIPVVDEGRLSRVRPDHVLILPWNLREELEESLSYVRDWGATFVTAVPELRVV